MFTVTYHRLFELVYLSALSAIALLVSQLPSAAIDPANLMFSPYTVVAMTSNVTATLVGVVHDVVVVLVLEVVVVLVLLVVVPPVVVELDPPVKVTGQFVLVAVL